MEHEIKQWIDFFQGLIFTHFRQNKAEAVEVLTWLLTGHLFGLYNLNQLADVLEVPKSSLYHHLSSWSLFPLFSLSIYRLAEICLNPLPTVTSPPLMRR